MASSSKTPVSILQEMAAKFKIVPPDYELLYDNPSGTNPQFQYKITFGRVTAIGIGRSKKEAKHLAAERALVELSKAEEEGRDVASKPIPAPEVVPSPYSNIIQRNYVGQLIELCITRNLMQPLFKDVSAEGPPHAPIFTMSCTVSKITETATASSKKQAKQHVAKNMYKRLQTCLKEELAELQVEQTIHIVNVEDEAAEMEAIFAKIKERVPEPVQIVPDSVEALHQVFLETYPDLKPLFATLQDEFKAITWNPVRKVYEVAEAMQVEYTMDCKPILEARFKRYILPLHKGFKCISKLDAKVCLVSLGKGLTRADAENDAAQKLLKRLAIFFSTV